MSVPLLTYRNFAAPFRVSLAAETTRDERAPCARTSRLLALRVSFNQGRRTYFCKHFKLFPLVRPKLGLPLKLYLGEVLYK